MEEVQIQIAELTSAVIPIPKLSSLESIFIYLLFFKGQGVTAFISIFMHLSFPTAVPPAL